MKSINENQSAEQTGKGRDYLRLPHCLIESAEWDALSGGAIKLLIKIAGQYNGRNNGDLTIKYRSFGSLYRRDAYLEELWPEFILATRKDAFKNGGPFAIMWEEIDEMNDIQYIHEDECMFRTVFKGDYERDEDESEPESGAVRGT